jgi:methionine salvage enolase-phosphatase E1
MNNAEMYFNQQKQNPEFIETYNQISEQVDIEWELERVKNQIKNGIDKNIIISELEKLQSFIHQAIFLPSQTKMPV